MISLRQAIASDLENIHELFCQTIDSSCIVDYTPDQRAAWKTGASCQRWQNAIKEQYFLVAEIAGDVAGFGSLLDNRHIDFMFTSKNHLRMGVAKSICMELEAKAAKAGSLIITSDVSKTAVPFFKSRGFAVTKTNHLNISGVDIVNFRMEKRLVSQV